MLKTIITVLCCLVFLLFGLVGDELQDLLPLSYDPKGNSLPALTEYYKTSFPLNSGNFLQSCLVFCGAILFLRLLEANKLARHINFHFTEYCLVIVLLFALHFGLFALALALPYHLLVGPLNDHNWPTFLNIATWILDTLFGLAVLVLLIRIISRNKRRATFEPFRPSRKVKSRNW